jgi:hypothetical protein
MLLIIPVLVTIILFLINSGAYVVPLQSPTSGFSGISANAYLQVDKVADPEGPFKNADLPLNINYTITITAKRTMLTNISIEETCQIITAKGVSQCPSTTPSNLPTEIYASTPYTFSYGRTYSGSEYKDSLVVNTVTVYAYAEGGGQQEAVTSAAIKIGNPPEDCPNYAWPIANFVGQNDVTQGPYAPYCSHKYSDAIDIGVVGETAIAVHSGMVTTGTDSCVGKYVKITSTCGSTTFSSLYGHLGAVSVKNGQRVLLGQTIGITDNTGSCTTGEHLHFGFKSPSGIPTVQKPYLIRNTPIGCCSRITCN